uniref:Uncharacterized protein n=1 Tax=Anguilla anguilla TaxID=7936 RepID=A0A0E9RGD5_ANGAN
MTGIRSILFNILVRWSGISKSMVSFRVMFDCVLSLMIVLACCLFIYIHYISMGKFVGAILMDIYSTTYIH